MDMRLCQRFCVLVVVAGQASTFAFVPRRSNINYNEAEPQRLIDYFSLASNFKAKVERLEGGSQIFRVRGHGRRGTSI